MKVRKHPSTVIRWNYKRNLDTLVNPGSWSPRPSFFNNPDNLKEPLMDYFAPMIRNTLVAALLSIILLSCHRMKDPVFNGIENVKVNSVTLGSSELTLDMKFFNPNHSGGRLKTAEGQAWMDSTFLGNFVVDSSIAIPANTDFLIPVKLNVEMKNILQNSIAAFLKKEVTIIIKGHAKVGRSGLYKNVSLNYQGKQDIQKLFN